jgi:putative CocE/NonD family hydrolase
MIDTSHSSWDAAEIQGVAEIASEIKALLGARVLRFQPSVAYARRDDGPMSWHFFLVAALGGLAGLPLLTSQPVARSSLPLAGSRPLVVEKNVQARMRDGVILRADIYRPDVTERLPALLQRTPYSKAPSREDSMFQRLAAHGFVVVVQDTRGRYMSDGVARPHDEGEDGYDTIEWVAQLPYVNGRVGTFGGSYSATTQLLAAPLRPPHLVAVFPSSSYNSRYDMVFQGGAFYLADGLSWNLGQAVDVRRRQLQPTADRDGAIGLNESERQLLTNQWMWHVPLDTMDAMELRRYMPAYFEMLQHPTYDTFWQTFDVEARHGEFDVPAYHLTGWYDTLLNGTLRNFAGLRRHARSARARENQRIVIGPWTHARPTPRSTTIGDVDFGPTAGFDLEALMYDWFDYWLKNAQTPGLSRAPVRLFVMGANVWRDEQEWPLARAVPTPFYFHSAGAANSLDGNGSLSHAKPGDEPPDRFVYDPWHPVPTGQRGGYSRTPSDQRGVEMRQDVLVYTSAPLETAVEVTGPIEVRLWAASSATDTDFTAKLVHVLPDGTARMLTDGILRARYRESKTRPVLLRPGQPEELRIDVGATSNLFGAGHRIRVEISSSNFPRFDRNPNTGAAFGTSSQLLRAQQVVFHDVRRPSHMVLPIVRR